MRPHDLARRQLLVRFGYDGSRFQGLQPQLPGVPTAGAALRDRLAEAAGAPAKALNFAARTDAGVHAIANIATCYWRELDVDDDTLLAGMCRARDDGLVDVRAYRVPPDVHARGNARGKRYRYLVRDGAPDELAAVHARDQTHMWAVAPRLDVEGMRAAARHFEGTHDFSSLRGGACSAREAQKTLAKVSVARDGAGHVVVELVGNAFLRKMVRNLVGVLGEVGVGMRDPESIPALLEARDRSAAGPTAPAGGLTLVEVGCTWPPDGSWLLPELRGVDVYTGEPADE